MRALSAAFITATGLLLSRFLIAAPAAADDYPDQELNNYIQITDKGYDQEVKDTEDAVTDQYARQDDCATRGGVGNLDGAPGCTNSSTADALPPKADRIAALEPVEQAPTRSCAIAITDPSVQAVVYVPGDDAHPHFIEAVYQPTPASSIKAFYQPVVFFHPPVRSRGGVGNLLQADFDLGPIMNSAPIRTPSGGQGNNQRNACETNIDGKPVCGGMQENSQTIAQALANMDAESGGTVSGPGAGGGAWTRPKNGRGSIGRTQETQETNQRKPVSDQDPQNQDGCQKDGALNIGCQGSGT